MAEETGAQASAPQTRERVGFFGRLTGVTRATRAGFREASYVLDVVRAPLGVSLLGALVFGFPGQIYEIYRLYAEDFIFGATLTNLRFTSFIVMLWITCYVLWYVARVLTIKDERTCAALTSPDASGRAARWFPRLIGAAPAFAAAYGMTRAELLRDVDVGPGSPVLYVAAAIAFVIGLLRLWSSWRRSHGGQPEAYLRLADSALRIDVRLTLAAVLLAGIGYLLTQPIGVTQWVGALSIICFFMVALVFGWAQLTYVYDKHAIPALTILVGAALLWSLLDINDNHFLRELPVEQSETKAETVDAAAAGPDVGPVGPAAPSTQQAYGPRPPLTTRAAFEKWLDSRGDREAYKRANKRYPVYVIAAQGGGLYAAYQSAMFMAKLQDACPTFAQHVFAISGVSGGAVGAATFTALALEHAENQKIEDLSQACGVPPTDASGAPVRFTEKTNAMLSQDFLSPLVSGMLFGDFTARFSPAPIPIFDRARALEGAFERSWEVAHPGDDAPNRLDEGLLTYWRPDGAAPAVVFNATQAENGLRLALSPIEEIGEDLPTYAVKVQRRADGSLPDIRLSTAAMVSARFPYITPAASLRLKPDPDAEDGLGDPKLRLVDGGYYENSGLDTAVDLMRAARPAPSQRVSGAPRVQAAEAAEQRADRFQALRDAFSRYGDVDLRVIVFDLTEDRFRGATYAFGEALTPIKALLNARVSRSALAQNRAREQYRAPCRYIFLGGGRPPSEENQICLPSESETSRIWSVSLNDYEYDFQLGWILSGDTLERINRQLGSPAGCAPRLTTGVLDQAIVTEEEAAAGEVSDDTAVKEDPYAQVSVDQRTVAFSQGVSITQSAGAPPTEDALARHNSCVASFVVKHLEGQLQEPPRRFGRFFRNRNNNDGADAAAGEDRQGRNGR